MVNNAETTARNAEHTNTWEQGYCLQFSRSMAAIASKYGDAATAWQHTHDRHPGDRNPPRGSMCYWTGGSKGYGHIAPSVGNVKIRSSDAGGAGKVATVDLGWVEAHWGLKYAGWAWDVNDVTIPHDTSSGGGGSGGGSEGEDDMEQTDSIAKWSPDDGDTGDTTVGKTLNQARGYSEDTYQRLKKLQSEVDDMSAKIDKIWDAVKS